MRKTLLATTAIAFGLALGGTAIAADDTTKEPGAAAGAGATGGTSGDATMEKNMDSGTTGGATTGGSASGSASTTMGADEEAASYRSLNLSENFSGPIAGGFQADELIGTDVVDANGDTIGEVSDVLIGPDGNANHVLVGVGGFLGIGAKNVALSIDELTRRDEVLVTSMTETQLEAKSAYTEQDDSWVIDTEAEGETGGKM